MKDTDGRLSRWALKLQHCDFTIHQNSNALSRLFILSQLAPEYDCIFDIISTQYLALKTDNIQKHLRAMVVETQIGDGHLYKLLKSTCLPYVKPS